MPRRKKDPLPVAVMESDGRLPKPARSREDPLPRLSKQEAAFLDAYTRLNFNGLKAAIEVGIAEHHARYWANNKLRTKHIQAHLALTREALGNLHYDLAHLATRHYRRVLEGDPREVIRHLLAGGSPESMSEEDAALIGGIEARIEMEGPPDDQRPVRVLKVRLVDPRGAADSVHRLLGNIPDPKGSSGSAVPAPVLIVVNGAVMEHPQTDLEREPIEGKAERVPANGHGKANGRSGNGSAH